MQIRRMAELAKKDSVTEQLKLFPVAIRAKDVVQQAHRRDTKIVNHQEAALHEMLVSVVPVDTRNGEKMAAIDEYQVQCKLSGSRGNSSSEPPIRK
ncbi:hypothetical protein BH20VER3_BH20VER3_02540 [soil metagenome]